MWLNEIISVNLITQLQIKRTNQITNSCWNSSPLRLIMFPMQIVIFGDTNTVPITDFPMDILCEWLFTFLRYGSFLWPFFNNMEYILIFSFILWSPKKIRPYFMPCSAESLTTFKAPRLYSAFSRYALQEADLVTFIKTVYSSRMGNRYLEPGLMRSAYSITGDMIVGKTDVSWPVPNFDLVYSHQVSWLTEH